MPVAALSSNKHGKTVLTIHSSNKHGKRRPWICMWPHLKSLEFKLVYRNRPYSCMSHVVPYFFNSNQKLMNYDNL